MWSVECVRQSKRKLTGISSAHQTHKTVVIQIAIPLQNVPLEVVQACGLLLLWERKKQSLLKLWRAEYQLGQYAQGNLHLKLICAIRVPRIWTGCIGVSWWGTESPATNLSSFFKSPPVWEYLQGTCLWGRFLLGKKHRWTSPFNQGANCCAKPAVQLVRKSARGKVCKFVSYNS